MRGRVRGNCRVWFCSVAGAGDCPSDHNLAGGSQADARIRRDQQVGGNPLLGGVLCLLSLRRNARIWQ